jgi:hypothetical protein
MNDDEERSKPTHQRPLTAAALDAGHRMFQRYLESAYPEALVLAEDVLRLRPEDPMALAVYRECIAAIVDAGPPRDRAPTSPDSDADGFGFGPDGPTEADTSYDRDATPPASSVAPPLSGPRVTEMYDLFLAGDFRAALSLSESILDHLPEDDLARAVRSQCCDALGIEARVPALRKPSGHHRAALEPE